MPIQRSHLLALALTACVDVPDVAEVGSEIGTTTTVTEPAPPTSPTSPTPPTPPYPPSPPTTPSHLQYASEFCRTLKNPATTTDQKKVIAAVLAAEAYDSDRGWKVVVKDGLARIQFDFVGKGLIGNHNFSAQLYADVNNPLVPGGCFALAIEGTQFGKGTPANGAGDIWTDMEASEIRRLGVLNDDKLDGGTQRQLPGGPPTPLYVAAGFEQVAAHAAKLVDSMVKDYPEFLPTAGNIEVELVTGQSMGGAIAGVLAHSIEHFMLQVRLPGPPDAMGVQSCPTEASPMARIINKSGGFLYQAPRAIAVVGNTSVPANPPIHHIYQPDDLVPQLPSMDLRSVQTGTFGVPVHPFAPPNTTLSTYTNWPDPTAIRWNTTGSISTTTVSYTTTPMANPAFTIPALTFSATWPSGKTDTRPCSESPRGRALNMLDNVACDGNVTVGIVGNQPPKNLDSSSGFLKYAFAYAAGRVPDENLAPWLRPDNEINNRYPALMAGGLPIPPDSTTGKTCKWGTYCNNPVGMGGMLRTLFAPLLQNTWLDSIVRNLYFWNPPATATFATELAAGALGTLWFHNPYTVSVAVGRLIDPALMVTTLRQIPLSSGENPWTPKFTCPTAPGLVGLDCIDGVSAPPVPGPNGLVQARACAIAI